MKTKSIVICLAVALASLAGAPAVAQDTGAVAVVHTDGLELFRIAFAIHRTMHDVVDPLNAAVAVASCTECTAIAISIQVVLAMSDPTVVAPTNLALAMNVSCTACEAYASAAQWVLGTGGPVRLTPEGARAIARIRTELQRLRTAGLPLLELRAAVDGLVQELGAVLSTELVPVGPPQQTDAAASPSPSPTPSETSGSPSPEASPEVSPTETQAATPTPSPSPSPSST